MNVFDKIFMKITASLVKERTAVLLRRLKSHPEIDKEPIYKELNDLQEYWLTILETYVEHYEKENTTKS